MKPGVSWSRSAWAPHDRRDLPALGQAAGLLPFCRRFVVAARDIVNFGFTSVWLGIGRPQVGRFFEVTKRIGILLRDQALPRKAERGREEEIGRSGILRIELMRAA